MVATRSALEYNTSSLVTKILQQTGLGAFYVRTIIYHRPGSSAFLLRQCGSHFR
jgi:hypothetical protein